jgi:ribonuclease HI
VVRSTFLPFEAENILGIPLSHTRQADKLIWGGTKTGDYAVHSGYHLLLEESHSNDPGSSNAVSQAQVWKSIWSLQIPHKVRHFLWRACHDSLPTRKNLHHRHIIDDPKCPNCTVSIEDTYHALWNCKNLQEVWKATEWGRKLKGSHYVDFMELYCAINHTFRTEELQIFAMVTWSIWYRRNRQRLNHPLEEIHRLLPRSIELLMEFHRVQDDLPPRPASTRPACNAQWKPPAEGSYKANFDGAIFAETSEAGIGVIIRNDQGNVMASLSQRIPYPHSVAAVEVYAARSATQFALDLGFRDLIFEGDSLQIITALQHHSSCNTQYGHPITDTITIAQNFISCHFVHVKRDGNRVAHSLAKRARHCEPFKVWMESVPPDLQHVTLSDFLLN